MSQQPVITIMCSFTRLSILQRWLSDLDHLDIDPSRTNLAFIVDGCSKDIENPHKEAKEIYARLLHYINHRRFRNFKLVHNEGHLVNEANIPIRRQRIAEIKNQSKQLIAQLGGPYVLGLEDDTIFEKCSVQKMLKVFSRGVKVGMVTGYQAGRWGTERMIGVWQFDDPNSPTSCSTLTPIDFGHIVGSKSREFVYEGLQLIDAAGFYFYLTPTSLYLRHNYSTDITLPYGPDVEFGLWLRQQGYVNYVDWSMPCGHNIGDVVVDGLVQKEVILWPDRNLISERFKKTELGWERLRRTGVSGV